MEEERIGLPEDGGRRKGGRQRPLNENALRELVQSSPNNILLRLSSEGGGLDDLLNDVTLSDRKISLFLQAIDKSFVPQMLTQLPRSIAEIVDKILNSRFFHTLNVFVSSFIDGSRERVDPLERDSMLSSVLSLLCRAMEIYPIFAFEKAFQFKFLLHTIISQSDRTDEGILVSMGRFENLLAQHNPRRGAGGDGQAAGGGARGMRVNQDDEQPTENFRELPLVPTQRDLASDEQVFLRRNRESGRYQNLEQYLDIQFRLFRADFILPLRESIDKFLGDHAGDGQRGAGGGGGGGRGVRVYHDVRIMRPVCKDREIAYRLSFDASRLGSVDWRSTQRLKYGSLVCLSLDNFQTFFSAVVQEREAALLSNGLVDVVFILDREEICKVTEASRDHRFVMVESPAYFEAYRHVLQGMKNLNDQNFPFIQYIVECNPAINAPAYLQRGVVRYDFQPLLDDTFVIKDQAYQTRVAGLEDLDVGTGDADNKREVEVMSGRDWPTFQELKLDDSQYNALHNALTREFAIIQGPPGTGKTFLGLKIVKMLLHNAQHWDDPAQKRPMLIVCYTNHALDQFLEEILKFFRGTLVRVGARSKSEQLKECSLNNFRTRARENRKVPMEVHEAKMRARDELRALRLEIHSGAAKLEIAEQEVVKEFFLESHILDNLMKSFNHHPSGLESESMMLRWLKLEDLHQRLVEQAECRLDKLPPARRSTRRGAVASQQVQGGSRFDDPDSDYDDDDEETIDITASFRDHQLSRMLDDDYDDDLDFDLDIGLEMEESDSQKVRRRLQQLEAENILVRESSVALSVTGFCDRDETGLMDRTKPKPTRENNKEVAENFRKLRLQYKHRLQGQLRSTDRMSEEEVSKVKDVWNMPVKDRWRLYRYWIDRYCRQMRGEIRQNEETYHNKVRKYREVLDQEDRIILQNATIIGMTTTGAARYQSVLQGIGPRIVIVEEAAEVFEAHIVATLSRECQHLILIGDHKQLRPNPVVFDLAKKFNLDVSLFERMIRNSFAFDCLEYQHRMRPEISSMMRLPELYPNLRDHDIVKQYGAVRGVKHNVFYINHSRPESRDEETKSFSNEFEACFMVAFCDYLLKQGYESEQITILTPYSGQIRILGSLMPKSKFGGVRVSSVDNFQGEENDIVLLSLVRSNSDNDIGFLKMENRICVALSRAKMGLYVMGNFETLYNSSKLLENIVKAAKIQKIFGSGLPLACQVHSRGDGIMARSADDFRKAPEGGCQEQCNVRLPCGHVCLRMCHPASQRDHDSKVCPMECSRQCSDCGQMCTGEHACDQHEFCTNMVVKRIPRCGHEQQMPCGMEPMRFICKEPCDTVLDCGHHCQASCGEPHTVHCNEMMPVDSTSCGHQFQAKCCERTSAACVEPCSQELVCGHKCQGSCGDCSHGRLHVTCQQRCRKTLVCQHDCDATCCQCPPCRKPCQNRCIHSYCDKQCGQPCVTCKMKCEWQCDHKSCNKTCGQLCDRDRCSQPCRKLLKCGHPCVGLCGERCPPLCRTCDEATLKEATNFLLGVDPEDDDRFVFLEDCGHVFEYQALDQWVDGFRPQQQAPEDRETQRDADEGEEGSAAGEPEHRLVKMPECPQCKTPIRRNLRYGNVIKACLEEIDIIKRRCLGDQSRIDQLKRRLEQANSRVPQDLKDRVQETLRQGGVQCESLLATQFYQVTLVIDINQLLRQVSSARTRWPNRRSVYDPVQQNLEHFISWTLRPRNILTDQEVFDAKQEFRRLRILMHLLHCRHAISSDDIQVEPRIMRRLAANIRILMEGRPLAENDLEEGRQIREELNDVVPDPYSALTDEEREQIVKAISLPTGQWYACPRGHYYVIGECGRPTETARCLECRGVIGGENHAFVEGNRWAPEMDNAEGPVWDEARDFEMARMLQEEEYRQAGFML